MQFDIWNFYKQVDALKIAISEFEITDQCRVLVLKTKLISLNERIENTFSELHYKEHDENLEAFMKYQDEISNLSVELETKTCIALDNSRENKSANNSKSKEGLDKLPK